MTAPEQDPRVLATEYRVIPTAALEHPLLDEDETLVDHFAVRVAARSYGDAHTEPRYAVLDRMGDCLRRDGTWDYEPLPSSRDDQFLAETRFDLQTALDLAAVAADHTRLNGKTYAEWIAAQIAG